MLAQYLQSHRKSVNETARYRHTRNARQVRRDRIDIVEVHLQWVCDLLANLEGNAWRGWTHDHVYLLECALVVSGDKGAHLLGLLVIGIIVPCAECIGT